MVVRAALPACGVTAQVVCGAVVMLANRYEIVLVKGIVITRVMDMQRPGAFPEPTQGATTVAFENLFSNR